MPDSDPTTEQPAPSARPARFEARGLHVTLGGKKVLHGIDAEFAPGEVFGIIGANGSGKSTCLRGMLGLLPCDAGAIRWRGRPLGEFDARTRAREIAYLPQNAECSWPMTVGRVVLLGRLPFLPAWAGPGTEDRRAVRETMESVNIAHLADRPATELSGGERSRVLLARALAGAPRILFADEPSSGLDPYHELQIMELFHDQARRAGTTVVVVLHNLTLASRFCDRLLLLEEGRIVATGAPDTVLQPENLKKAYGIEARVLEVDSEQAVIPWRRLGE